MLELTSRCNLRCGMCPMDVLTRPFEDAPFDMVEDVARQMRELGLPMKYLHEMGEPFLYKRLCPRRSTSSPASASRRTRRS